ncbi:MAG: hypothetical protein K0Q94_564 [Paenibacillus sp.]|nr:hypothetical protein [Paenibacillus sp.]
MPRRRRAPPTRFPDAIALSYYRQVAKLIQQMHSVTYGAFQKMIVPEAKRYRTESAREDDALDIILAILEFAKSRSRSFVFTASNMLRISQQFVSRVSDFNRRNIDDQVEAVKGIDPTINEPWLDSFVRSSVAENVTLIQSIEQDYHKRVESIVLQGVKNGESLKDMAADLKKTADISYNRAKFIARDQTGSIMGQLTEKRHLAAGVERFKWSTSGDERVRPEHRAFDGKVYTYAEGAGGRHLIPGRDYNCRCVAYPVFDDE